MADNSSISGRWFDEKRPTTCFSVHEYVGGDEIDSLFSPFVAQAGQKRPQCRASALSVCERIDLVWKVFFSPVVSKILVLGRLLVFMLGSVESCMWLEGGVDAGRNRGGIDWRTASVLVPYQYRNESHVTNHIDRKADEGLCGSAQLEEVTVNVASSLIW